MSSSGFRHMFAVEKDFPAPDSRQEKVPRDRNSKVRAGHGGKVVTRRRRRDLGILGPGRDVLVMLLARRRVLNRFQDQRLICFMYLHYYCSVLSNVVWESSSILLRLIQFIYLLYFGYNLFNMSLTIACAKIGLRLGLLPSSGSGKIRARVWYGGRRCELGRVCRASG